MNKTCDNPNCMDEDCQKIHRNDPVNPTHYRDHPSGVECIQISREMDFCLGNAFKYLFRCGSKGHALEDLRKALWYLEYRLGRCRDSWWSRMWHSCYDVTADAPHTVHIVCGSEHRYSGHMAAALGHVWAAHECRGVKLHLARAIRSVETMIGIEKARLSRANTYCVKP